MWYIKLTHIKSTSNRNSPLSLNTHPRTHQTQPFFNTSSGNKYLHSTSKHIKTHQYTTSRTARMYSLCTSLTLNIKAHQKHIKFLMSMFTGAVAALRAAGRASRAIYSKNFLQDKGSISDKESISDKGSISDKESISYIISPKNRVNVHWGRSGAARRRARFARHIFKKLPL